MDANWIVLDLIAEQAMREREETAAKGALLEETAHEGTGLRRALAGRLVRLGLRLDPAAGEGLGALKLSSARPGGGATR